MIQTLTFRINNFFLFNNHFKSPKADKNTLSVEHKLNINVLEKQEAN